MSKLIDRLEKLGEPAATPMGFGAASRSNEGPLSLLLIGATTLTELKKSPKLLDTKVDAVAVSVDLSEEGLADGLVGTDKDRDRLWGVRVNAVSEDQAQQLKETGCDFLIFDAEDTDAAVLNDEELGKLLNVGHELDEEVGRAIQDLPIDGVLFSPQGDLLPLTVKKLIELKKVSGLVDKPLVIEAPSSLGQADLEALRDAGIGGLVVQLSEGDAIGALRESIAALPRRKPSSTPRPIVALRGTATEHESHSHGDEEDDQDDDF